jgi:cation diffusion facilitator family transporter
MPIDTMSDADEVLLLVPYSKENDGINVAYGSADADESDTVNSTSDDDDQSFHLGPMKFPSLRRLALKLSLYFNVAITIVKLVAYFQTFSLSVLAALLDSLLDVVSQLVLNYTEKHSSRQRSSAFYPAGAARLEPIGVLTCAALMGMASFEVLKESTMQLIYHTSSLDQIPSLLSFWSMLGIVFIKMGLLWICNRGANRRAVVSYAEKQLSTASKAVLLELSDPTMEALSQDHFNDALSNTVAAVSLLFALRSPSLWFLDPLGAIMISVYIIYSWFQTGAEQIQHLTGMGAPDEFIDELKEMASAFDDRVEVDTVRAYHFGPKFLVEVEVVMPKETSLFESHDVGMELQYEIESREEVERCFVHIDCTYTSGKITIVCCVCFRPEL